MRIKSNFRDYYDKAMSFGHDDFLTYVRYDRFVDSPVFVHSGQVTAAFSREHKCIDFEEVIIGFCGETYKAVSVCVSINGERVAEQTVHTEERLLQFLEAHVGPKQLDRVLNATTLRRPVKEFFEASGKYLKPFFTKFRVPLFVVRPRSAKRNLRLAKNDEEEKAIYNDHPVVILNAALKEFEFFRVFDAFSAFQEIEMFLGSIANPEPSMIKTSDKTRLEAHGFDNKTSFRRTARH